MTQPADAASLPSPPAAADAMPRAELFLLLTLAGVQFTSIVDFMVMMPLGPQFRTAFGTSDAQFGFLVSAYTLAAAVTGVVTSGFIDRFARKPLLLWVYVLFGLATLACGLATSYATMMAARIAAGVFGGVLGSLVMTIIGDVVPIHRRGRAMAILMTAFSLASVAGVPSALLLAQAWSWASSFYAIAALCGVFLVGAALSLPRLDAHLAHPRSAAWTSMWLVVRDRNHLLSFLLTTLLMGAGFTVIPFLTLYLQANGGVPDAHIPAIYLFGGIGSFATAAWIGRAADRHGKVRVLRALSILVMPAMLAVTVCAEWPFALVLVATTAFFVLSSGRMIPFFALLSGAARPELRGAFMNLNSAVQSAAIGLGAILGGALVSRSATGQLQGYWHGAAVAIVAGGVVAWLAGRVRSRG